jgi:hypothetical protein
MRAVEHAIVHHAAVQVDQRLAGLARPRGESLARLLVVAGDSVIIDCIKRSLIGSHRLVGFLGGNAAQFFAAVPLLRRGGQGCGQ